MWLVRSSGDYAAHGLTARSQAILAASTATEIIVSAFPDTPKLFALGNDDFYPDYDFVVGGPQLAYFWSLWKDYLPASAESTFLEGGYYAVTMHEDLLVLVLNSVIYNPEHQFVCTVFLSPHSEHTNAPKLKHVLL